MKSMDWLQLSVLTLLACVFHKQNNTSNKYMFNTITNTLQY